MLISLKRAFVRNGRLTSKIIDRHKAGSYSGTYIKRFGSLFKVYEQVGFRPPASRFATSQHAHDNRELRKSVLRQIEELFPAEVRIVHSRKEQKEVVEVDGTCKVSVLLCGKRNAQA